jgi:PAS domain S-box-containing protein
MKKFQAMQVPDVSPAGGSFNQSPNLMSSLASGLRQICAQKAAALIQQTILRVALDISGAAVGRFVSATACMQCGAAPSDNLVDAAAMLPATVVAHACQTRQIVCIADTRQPHAFSSDPFLQQLRVHSILCMPLVSDKDVLGLIYLEDLAAPCPDVAALIAALDVLAAGAAAALENAALREHILREDNVHRKSETELAFKQNLLRTLVDNIPFRIYAKDRESRFLFGNNQMARLAGLAAPAELFGKTDFEFFPANLAAKYFADEQNVLQSGEALLDYEELVEDQDTGELGWTMTTKVLLRNDDGEVIGIVGIGYDVTPRKRMEARLLERSQALEIANATLQAEKEHQQVLIRKLGDMQGQLLQSEKMASIGLLAAGVAHEINNPLAFISSNFRSLQRNAQRILELVGFYERIESQLPAGALVPIARLKQEIGLDNIRLDMDDLLSESTEGLKRVKDIVQNLKDFSRASGTTNEMANLEEGLDSTLNVAWNEIKYKAEVTKEYGAIPEVSCLSSQINQVFLNLLVNAAHAIEEKGRIIVRTGYDTENVWVEIEDNGSGIAPEHLEHIFEPFFTTKPIGKGTGLGLSIVYGIIQGHNGKIQVESIRGRGTTFKVMLPRTVEAA